MTAPTLDMAASSVDLATAFKTLGDPVRLRLFRLLSLRREVCVCHLTEALALPQSTVSRHLGVLRHAGLVLSRRAGKWIYYRLNEGLAEQLAELVRAHQVADSAADVRRLEAILAACR